MSDDATLPSAEEFWASSEGRTDEMCGHCGAVAYSARVAGCCASCGRPWEPGERRATADEMPDIGETQRGYADALAVGRRAIAMLDRSRRLREGPPVMPLGSTRPSRGRA